MDKDQLVCPICKSGSSLLDVVDFNKHCNESIGNFFLKSGIPVYYSFCPECGFCWAPELHTWEFSKFDELIYNDGYIEVDPEYVEVRPRQNANSMRSMLPTINSEVKHLDFGGGNGRLAELLCGVNWNSHTYDPFVDREIEPESLGKFDLITAFEVFEHVSDVDKLLTSLCSLMANDGIVLFSTLLSDGNIRLNQRLSWWYASPRNGHISLFSKKSLSVLAKNYGLYYGNFSNSFHILFKTIPAWAAHLRYAVI